jgi:hypothetical protein
MAKFQSSITPPDEPEVTVDEADKFGFFDPFEIENKRPGYRYRFINMNERNVASKMRQGYEIVKDNDPEKMAVTDNTPLKAGSSIDTTRRFNDVVLARIPEEKFKKIQAIQAKVRERRSIEGVANTFKAEVGPTAYNEPGRGRYTESMTENQFDAAGGGTPEPGGDDEE